MNGRPRCYDDIKALKDATGLRIPELLALASTNDPFYIMPAQVQQGEWFAVWWSALGLQPGVHLRRIHYQLVSQPEPVLMVDGRPYQNTERCWEYLTGASKAARCLGLVGPDAFRDARNPDAVLHRDYSARPGLGLSFDLDYYGDLMRWDLPAIKANLAADLDWDIPGVTARGYVPTDHDQPFHLELISEKSTMDDVIVPLCRDLGVNYAPATGFQSITGAIALLKRCRQANKPGVVFYVSDFDPAGSFMPPAVARQLEYWLPTYAPGLPVLLLPVILTKQQVIDYGLPPIPIKESDRRQAGFLAKFGVEGATELDALEALHPGELARVLRDAIAPYRDAGAEQNAQRLEWQANKIASDRWAALARPYRWRMEQLKEEVAALVGRYEGQLVELRDDLADALRPLESRLNDLRQAVRKEFAEFDAGFDLPDRYESPLALPELFDGLFDSRRSYLEQIKFYKATATDPKN